MGRDKEEDDDEEEEEEEEEEDDADEIVGSCTCVAYAAGKRGWRIRIPIELSSAA